jgi:hypothetical protein
MSEQHQPAEAIGTVTHWFGHLSVAAELVKPRETPGRGDY